MSRRLKTLIPWLLSAAFVAFIATTTDLERFVETLRSLDPWAFAGVTLLGVAATYVTDCLCLKILFGRFFAPVAYRDLLTVKGTSYLLNVVNYNAGAGGVAIFLARRKGLDVFKAVGTMAFLNTVDLFALSALIALGLWLGPDVLDPSHRVGLTWALAGMGAVLVGTILFWVFKVPFLPRKVRELRIFHAFRIASLADYPTFIGLRLLFVSQYILIHWAYLRVFGIPIPFSHLMVFVPVLTFIGVLPISIAGLGTTQVAMRYFFAPYPMLAAAGGLIAATVALGGQAGGAGGAGLFTVVGDALAGPGTDPTALIDAYSTATLVGIVATRAVIGLITMRSVAADFIPPTT